MKSRSRLNVTLLCAASIVALSSAARAQDAAATGETVVVTGSRIQMNGNELPTPVTVVSAAELAATTPSSIPDALNKLPEFDSTQSTTAVINGANGKGSNAPGNFLSLRGLGSIRTLILQDGNRVPGTFYDQTVDTDMLPQMLVQRVEVVTGGASAVYGSDAVTGVVNFITDNKYNGLKGMIQGGISDYGDVKSFKVGLASGMDIGSHGHLIGSIEYYNRAALTDESTRPYGTLNAALLGAGTAAAPYTLATNVIRSNESWGGLPLTGPFAAPSNSAVPFGPGQMTFAKDGSLVPFHVGATTNVANTVIGGDGSYQYGQMLVPGVTTAQGFGRFDYNFTDDLHAYASARYSIKRTLEANQHISNSATNFPITIYSGNAYLTPSEQATLTSTNTSSFTMARDDDEFTRAIALLIQTGALSVSAGVDGKAWGDFVWDAHYTHGETRTDNTTLNNTNAARFYAASDAVTDPATGNIVCHVSITAPGAFPGCVPVDLFGQGKPSQAAINYIDGTTWWVAHNGMDDFGGNLTGTAFNDWAGPVKVAVDAEYRLASLVVTTSTPDPSFNPQYLRLGAYSTWGPSCSSAPSAVNVLVPLTCEPIGPNNTLGPIVNGQPTAKTSSYAANSLAWIKEVQSPANGAEDVSEANIEVDAPLLKDLPLVEMLSFNGAYRYTQYSTAGNGVTSAFSANTWKLGLEWQLFDDLRLRATRSRDIRAPTLWDLYQLQSASSGGFNDSLVSHATGSVTTVSGGNPNLKPEVARNTTAGVVYSPGWLPDFSISADYYHIVINNAVGAIGGTNTTIQNICIASQGASPYCALLPRPLGYNSSTPGYGTIANFPTFNYSLNQNIALNAVEGMDFEVNYQTDLGVWSGLDGIVHLRGLWTHQPVDKSQSLPGATITNAAGTGSAPSDKATFTVDYLLNNLHVNLLERYVAPIHWGADPTQVFAIPDVRAYFQTDIGIDYDFVAVGQPLTGYLDISNLTNTVGGLYPPTGAASVPGQDYPAAPYMDVIGRYYTVGFRFKM